MSIYNATSWGRTRRPKAPHNRDKNTITGSTLLALNQLSEAEFTDANGCYRTENQRYMHLMCSGSSTVTNVYAYNYAAGFWHEIVTGSSNSSVVVGNNQHQIVDINGADWVSVSSGSLSVVTMAFSTF
jgi:hypothetical protein